MNFRRMPIEVESPEQMGYATIRNNLAESSFRDAVFGDLDLDLRGLVLAYGDHLGHPGLRGQIALDHPSFTPDDVLVTPGAAGALFIVHAALLSPGDRILVAHTNYGTNLETPRILGAQVDLHELRFEEGFQIDVDRLAREMRPETKLVSLTCPHNPTGVVIDEASLRRVVALCEERGAWLLFDETYRDMTFGPKLPSAAALSPRAISVSSLSKTYGLPGIRIGWLLNRDPALQEKFLATKEQIVICNSIVDEEIAFRVLRDREAILPGIRSRIAEAFATVRQFMSEQEFFEWVEPGGGVVGFPRFREGLRVDVDRFYRVLLEEHGTYVGPGHWFETDRRHFRLGFGWPTPEELAEGLVGLRAAAAATVEK